MMFCFPFGFFKSIFYKITGEKFDVILVLDIVLFFDIGTHTWAVGTCQNKTELVVRLSH
jgi:hypothetical protein